MTQSDPAGVAEVLPVDPDDKAAADLIRQYWSSDEGMQALAVSIEFHQHPNLFSRAFARHRASATAQLEAENAELKGLLREAHAASFGGPIGGGDGGTYIAKVLPGALLNRILAVLTPTKQEKRNGEG